MAALETLMKAIESESARNPAPHFGFHNLEGVVALQKVPFRYQSSARPS